MRYSLKVSLCFAGVNWTFVILLSIYHQKVGRAVKRLWKFTPEAQMQNVDNRAQRLSYFQEESRNQEQTWV